MLVEIDSTYIVGAELSQDFVWDQGIPGHRSAAKFLLERLYWSPAWCQAVSICCASLNIVRVSD